MPRRRNLKLTVCCCPRCKAAAFIGGSSAQRIVCCFACGEFPYRAMFPKQLIKAPADDQQSYEQPHKYA